MVANDVQVDADAHPQQDLVVANEPGLGLVERSNTLIRKVLYPGGSHVLAIYVVLMWWQTVYKLMTYQHGCSSPVGSAPKLQCPEQGGVFLTIRLKSTSEGKSGQPLGPMPSFPSNDYNLPLID
jgi:hypothetical protein